MVALRETEPRKISPALPSQPPTGAPPRGYQRGQYSASNAEEASAQRMVVNAEEHAGRLRADAVAKLGFAPRGSAGRQTRPAGAPGEVPGGDVGGAPATSDPRCGGCETYVVEKEQNPGQNCS